MTPTLRRRKAVERILRRNGTPRAMVPMLALEIVDSLPGEGYELVACREWSRRLEASGGMCSNTEPHNAHLLEGFEFRQVDRAWCEGVSPAPLTELRAQLRVSSAHCYGEGGRAVTDATESAELRARPSDPVLDFIYDPAAFRLVMDGSDRWPYSRLSASRVTKIAYKLIVLRCAQIGVEAPTRQEAAAWRTR